nr:PREDICTED: uncharacterized protein LOC109042198 isoform X2 [Bemisia tabaci]
MARLMHSPDGQTKGAAGKSLGSETPPEKVAPRFRAVKECPKRRPSFKTRGLASATSNGGPRTYRATKITICSSNVAALASKFNAVIVQDDVKGRAFVKKLQNPHRKPLKTTKGSVKAAIEIFENKSEKASKKSGDRPKIVLIRKNSSIARLATKTTSKPPAKTGRSDVGEVTAPKKPALTRKGSSNRTEKPVSPVLQKTRKNSCSDTKGSQSCEEIIKNAKNRLRQTFILEGGSEVRTDRRIREMNKNSVDVPDGAEKKSSTLSRLPKNSDRLDIGKENYFRYKTLSLPSKPDLKPKPDLAKISKEESVDKVKADSTREQSSEKLILNESKRPLTTKDQDVNVDEKSSVPKFKIPPKTDRLYNLDASKEAQKNFKPNNSFLWRQCSYKKEETIKEENEIVLSVTSKSESLSRDGSTRSCESSSGVSRTESNSEPNDSSEVKEQIVSNKSSLHSSRKLLTQTSTSSTSSEDKKEEQEPLLKPLTVPEKTNQEYLKTKLTSNRSALYSSNLIKKNEINKASSELTVNKTGQKSSSLFDLNRSLGWSSSKDSGIDSSNESQRFSLPQTELTRMNNSALEKTYSENQIHNSKDSGIDSSLESQRFSLPLIEDEEETENSLYEHEIHESKGGLEGDHTTESCLYEEIVFRKDDRGGKTRTDYYDKISIDKLNILALNKSKEEESFYDQIDKFDRLNQDDHYTLISDYESNIYDDIVHVKGADDGDASNCYESIREGTLTKSSSQTSDSDSSWEHNNSLYALRPPSLHSTSSLSLNSGGRGSRAGKSETSDEWVDLEHSDEQQEILVLRERCRRRPSVTGWSVRMRRIRCRKSVRKHKHSAFGDENGSIEQNTYVNVETLEEDFSEEDYDDSFDSDSSFESDQKLPEKLPEPPHATQNIYGLVKQAGKRMRKHWSLSSLGLNRIRKMSIGAVPFPQPPKDPYPPTSGATTNGAANGNGLNRRRWSSFKSKFRNPTHSTSTFYLNDEPSDATAPPLPLSLPPRSEELPLPAERPPPDPRRLSTARPSSPPPPPPPVRPARGEKSATKLQNNKTEANNPSWYAELSLFDPSMKPFSGFSENNQIYSNIYSDSKLWDSSNSNSIHDSMSDQGSSPGSDLHLRFADEPLYQFYTADIAELARQGLDDDFDGYEEIGTLRPTALELAQHRSLWCELPEVQDSGILGSLEPAQRKLQEARFEVIQSEASYFKSLTVLDKHFVQSPLLNDEAVLTKNERRILFGNVAAVRKCSEKLLASLENCWQESIMMNGVCDAVLHHANKNFSIYIKYCSNQVYLDRTLKNLKERNSRFNEALSQIESDPICQSLSLHSFLMLPMQRITRLPLLIDAILSRIESDDEEFQTVQITLATLNKIVEECNEGARKFERYEEMLLLSRQLDFSRKDMKALPVVSSSRWLVRSGHMMHINVESKTTFSRKLNRHVKLHLFLFTDLLVITKKKSEENYSVIDYCARNLIQMTELKDPLVPSSKFLIMLTMLENHEGKTIEMVLACDSESSRQRWLEALSSPQSSNPEETLYEQWDCPQVVATHDYAADQPDELSLQSGDIVNVCRKTADGWYHGERIRDGEKGWFPANHTSEIVSAHTRARNLKVRYRLLALSGNYLQSMQRKKT